MRLTNNYTYITNCAYITLIAVSRNSKFPCKICAKNVQDKDKAVQCDLCELWIHIKCNIV